MSSIRGKNTKPEMIIRKGIWRKGHRFRIHDKSVMGKPDISNKKKRIAVFIDGCFWHGCPQCYHEPKSNTEFWKTKIHNNKKRRQSVKYSLKQEGWSVKEVWEHQINKNAIKEIEKISFLFQKNVKNV